ncbi:precorrin-6y C5,15-methyltransferase (decarboxylating) subunit CbiE [Zhongshania sp.]|uniref:precorrin-6y C5,15-methyltransferase (decarboxylating) subunit CbiE n=1 Tax=Zhongshania sp. TaxID=1971902 RepID=UPI003565BA47
MLLDKAMPSLSQTRLFPVDVIGLGVGNSAGEPLHLAATAQVALGAADWVIGSARQLALVAPWVPEQRARLLPKISELFAQLEDMPDKRVVVLASGDPLYYGIGRCLIAHFGVDALRFHAGVSSIQAACHRLALSLQDVDVLSLHGRPVSVLRRYLRAGARLLILTDKHSHPRQLAQLCVECGFSQARISVCENLGYPQEAISHWIVTELLAEGGGQSREFAGLHVSVIHAGAGGGVLPVFPGIADAQFFTDGASGQGMLTKREVRMNILSLMQVQPSDVVWDIGAGCGGVAVELARWGSGAQVYAVESHVHRLACLQQNRDYFGVPDRLHIIAGRAPGVLAELPPANKVFIGGSGGELTQILQQVWSGIPLGGCVVVSAVTETSQQLLRRFEQQLVAGQYRSEALQIAVSRRGELAGEPCFRPLLPVYLYRFEKTAARSEVIDNV